MARGNQISIDWITFSLYLSLVFIGWLTVYAVENTPGESFQFSLDTLVGKQAVFIAISALILLLILNIDWKFWRVFWVPIYVISILSLIAVLLFGLEVKGAQSWFKIGAFTLQPAEFAKFATSLAIANFLASPGVKMTNSRHVLLAVGMAAIPMALIILQPDAGSALLFASFAIVLYRAGLHTWPFILVFLLASIFILTLLFDPTSVIMIYTILSVILLWQNLKQRELTYLSIAAMIVAIGLFVFLKLYLWAILIMVVALIILAVYHVRKGHYRVSAAALIIMLLATGLSFSTNYAFYHILQPHQQERFNVWLHPERCDPHGSLYNVMLSKITIGSGGLSGKGYLQGNLTRLNYVPEQSTDFIFCTIGEDHGFVGSIVIIGLFTLLMLRLITIAERQRLNLFRYYAYCILGLMLFHFVINIGMTMGLVPIIGIPLPFISYGGSSLIAFTIMLGVLLKFDSQRYLH